MTWAGVSTVGPNTEGFGSATRLASPLVRTSTPWGVCFTTMARCRVGASTDYGLLAVCSALNVNVAVVAAPAGPVADDGKLTLKHNVSLAAAASVRSPDCAPWVESPTNLPFVESRSPLYSCVPSKLSHG